MVPVSLLSLWMPIALSAVLVFVVSSLVHMLFTYHKNDFRKLPAEDAARDALRPLAIPPGDYVVPYAGSATAMKSPEYGEKLHRGPVLMFTVLPNRPFAMGKSLAQWFGYSLLISLFAGYLASRTLAPGAECLAVFRIAATVAFVGYALGQMQHSIWYHRNWGATFRAMFDGLIYALVTGGAFGMLWPA
ncbi:MAG: hypothetical protein SGI84_06090 [Gemmatimonadota bacterium]|nr:hypothetical protein [Gemmatimonadota bacterium]